MPETRRIHKGSPGFGRSLRLGPRAGIESFLACPQRSPGKLRRMLISTFREFSKRGIITKTAFSARAQVFSHQQSVYSDVELLNRTLNLPLYGSGDHDHDFHAFFGTLWLPFSPVFTLMQSDRHAPPKSALAINRTDHIRSADVKPSVESTQMTTTFPSERIERSILLLRGHKILLDVHLAALYGVTTKWLNEQVKRNRSRFPADFMFQLTTEETASLRSQSATSNRAEAGDATGPMPSPSRA